MDSSSLQHDEDDAQDEGLFVVIVGDKMDEQPSDLDNQNTEPTIHLEMKPENSFLTCTEELKLTSDIKTEEQFEPMVEEYISDETDVPSDADNKDDIYLEELRESNEQKYLEIPDDNSFVAEICRMNPILKDDTEALVDALFKVMKDTMPLDPPDGFVVERNNMFECVDCGYQTTRSRYTLARHWVHKHGSRRFACMACGTTFAWITNLYRHERICNSDNAWLVLKARDRINQIKAERKINKQKAPSKKTLTVRELKSNLRVTKRKVSERAGKSKIFEQFKGVKIKTERLPKTKQNKAKQTIKTKKEPLKRTIATKRGATKRKIVRKSQGSPKKDPASKPRIVTESDNRGSLKKDPKIAPESDEDIDPFGGDHDSDPQYEPSEEEYDSDDYFKRNGKYSDPLNLLELKKPSRKRTPVVRKNSNRQCEQKALIDEKYDEYLSTANHDDPLSPKKLNNSNSLKIKKNPVRSSNVKVSVDHKSDPDHNSSYVDVKETKTTKNSLKTAAKDKDSCLKDSYLNRLRLERPDLMGDEELLVKILSEIMVKDKPPPLPKGFADLESNGMFQCKTCNHLSKSRNDAIRHWRVKHEHISYKCYACGAQFGLFRSLYVHERSCGAQYAYIVRRARVGTFKLTSRKNNKKKIYNETGTYICSFCPREFKRMMSLEAHENEHKLHLPYKCKQCPAAYTSVTALSHHKRRKHRKAELLCDKCDRAFTHTNELRTHMDTHLDVKKYACTECVRRFAQKQDLKIHVDRDHRNLPYPYACKLCPQRYPLMTKLRTHVTQKHGINVISRKSIYNKLPEISLNQVKRVTIAKKSELHTESDLTKISYDVQIIDAVKKEQKNEIELTDRSEDVDDDINGEQVIDEKEAKKVHECPHCKKRYVERKSLKKHIDRKHFNLFPFACKICYKRCAEEMYLRRHMQRHHGIQVEKPEQAKKRKEKIVKPTPSPKRKGYTYRNAEGVQMPFERDSTGKIPCPECDKKYSHMTDLRKHVNKIHLRLPEPYACKMCPKRCMKLVTLRAHMLKTHGMHIIARKTLKKHLPNLTAEQLKNAITVKHSDFDPTYEPIATSVQNLTETVNIDHHYTEVSEPIEIDGNFTDTEVLPGSRNISPKKCPVAPNPAIETSAANTCASKDEFVDTSHGVEHEDINDEEKGEETDETYDGEEGSDESEEPSEDIKEIVKKHVVDAKNHKPIIIIKDGQAVYMDGDNVDYFKKTTNCKIFNSPKTKVTVQYQEDLISETNKALVSYYKSFCQETTEKPPEVAKERPTKNKQQGSSGRVSRTNVRNKKYQRTRN
ncbi:hypothetical protein O0L34_g15908 [Tuta absoluta]|nr:hypothetical protein O0L34_g15908 [Tuta absoluta]